jgi:hypothetical protein
VQSHLIGTGRQVSQRPEIEAGAWNGKLDGAGVLFGLEGNLDTFRAFSGQVKGDDRTSWRIVSHKGVFRYRQSFASERWSIATLQRWNRSWEGK